MGVSLRPLAGRAFWPAVELVETTLRLALAIPRVLWQALSFSFDVVRSRRALRGGTLHCPIGHEVSTEGETYCCDACGFTYGGAKASIWLCGNPECGAISPYVNCPTCGLSCRNPYRRG